MRKAEEIEREIEHVKDERKEKLRLLRKERRLAIEVALFDASTDNE